MENGEKNVRQTLVIRSSKVLNHDKGVTSRKWYAVLQENGVNYVKIVVHNGHVVFFIMFPTMEKAWNKQL